MPTDSSGTDRSSAVSTGKPGRNDLCWCGSGKKYKKCHLNVDRMKNAELDDSGSSSQVIQRDPEFIEGMRRSCRLAAETLKMVEENIRPGMTTDEINTLVHDYTLDHGAIPAPLNYKGYPKSTCTSLNDVICHGIPDHTVIKEGDIINVDITSILEGYYGDTIKTFLIGECSDEAKHICHVAEECLRIGIEAVQPYGKLGDIGAAIQKYAHSEGCAVVEKFVGHGIGRRFHEEPQVPHFGKRGTGVTLLPGMFFTIEPMINLGDKDVRILEDNWTAKTIDGCLSAQYEHTLYLTESGVEVLTKL